MREFEIRSKVYIVPKKTAFSLIILNMCIAVTTLLALVSIVFCGIKVGNMSTIIIAFIMVFQVKSWYRTEPYYEFSFANVQLSHESMVINYKIGRNVVLDIKTINLIEYSDQLKCMRFVGNYTIAEKNKFAEYNCSEYLLYVDEDECRDFFDVVKEIVNMDIVYVDRK